MPRISIYIGRHLCTAPRAVKEADALAAAGHDVTVSGLWFEPRLVTRDEIVMGNAAWRFQPYADCRPHFTGGRLRWWWIRLRARLARGGYARVRFCMSDVFGYATSRMLAHARRHRPDLAIFHSEGGLWVANHLRADGARVGVDFEDWFSRDLPEDVRVDRPVAELEALEAASLRRDRYVVTTSNAMAEALATAYRGARPTVIYNTFPASDARPPKAVARPVSLHWFSQTIGRGRGLEELFKVLPQLEGSWRLVLRGDDPAQYARTLMAALPSSLRGRVEVLPTVPNAELPCRIAEHDIGLALETNIIPNKDLTVSNKLFQYLQAGLAVIATGTAGHREILGQAPDAGLMIPRLDVDALRVAMQALLADPSRLQSMKQQAFLAGSTRFAHDRQVPLYDELVERALDAPLN